MSYRDIFKILGYNFLIFSFVLLIPLAVSFYYSHVESAQNDHSSEAFFLTFLITLSLAALFSFWGRKAAGRFSRKEALFFVVFIWFVTPALSALPFIFSGTISNPIQAYFEAASGLTTTGATILEAKRYEPDTGEEIKIQHPIKNDQDTFYSYYGTVKPIIDNQTKKVIAEGIEAVSKPILFWRSFIQWIGGLGIVVIFVALLPSLGISGKLLFQAEVTDPFKGALMPRVTKAAFVFFSIYSTFTILECLLLKFTNSHMTWFDAITISLSTLPTGGFSVHSASIGFYQNHTTELIVALFMVIGATNFTIFYHAFRGKLYRISTAELLLFLTAIAVSGSLAVWFLNGKTTINLSTGATDQLTPIEAIRYGFFQIISSITSTGFTTTNYDIWPMPVQALMLILMFVGGMSGSTAGGIKTIRLLIFAHIARYRAESLFKAEPIRQIRVANLEVDTATTTMMLCTMVIWIVASVLGTFLYIADNLDFETAMGLTACMVNNVGLSFRGAGPAVSCAFLSDFGLILSSLLMILGRLEFFAVLALLSPSFWKST